MTPAVLTTQGGRRVTATVSLGIASVWWLDYGRGVGAGNGRYALRLWFDL